MFFLLFYRPKRPSTRDFDALTMMQLSEDAAASQHLPRLEPSSYYLFYSCGRGLSTLFGHGHFQKGVFWSSHVYNSTSPFNSSAKSYECSLWHRRSYSHIPALPWSPMVRVPVKSMWRSTCNNRQRNGIKTTAYTQNGGNWVKQPMLVRPTRSEAAWRGVWEHADTTTSIHKNCITKILNHRIRLNCVFR